MHIKITLHIQVLVYCKNVPAQLIMGLPRMGNSLYTAQKIEDSC